MSAIPIAEGTESAIKLAGEFFRNPFGMIAVCVVVAIAVLWRSGVVAKNETIKVIAKQLDATAKKAADDLVAAGAREELRVLDVQKRADEYRSERNEAERRMQAMSDELKAVMFEVARHMPDLKRLQKWTRAKEREDEERERRPVAIRPKLLGEGGE